MRPRQSVVIVVAREEPDLLRYLRLRFARDPTITVVAGDTGGEYVAIERRPSPSSGKDLSRMSEHDTVEDRRRLERWLEDGRYMLGEAVPALVEERDRLRTRAEAAEDECGRLRHEVLELRKVINDLNSEGQYLRQEHAAIAESLDALLGQLAELQRPLHEVQRRIQSVGARPAE